MRCKDDVDCDGFKNEIDLVLNQVRGLQDRVKDLIRQRDEARAAALREAWNAVDSFRGDNPALVDAIAHKVGSLIYSFPADYLATAAEDAAGGNDNG